MGPHRATEADTGGTGSTEQQKLPTFLPFLSVIPAQAGIQTHACAVPSVFSIPAFAGMTYHRIMRPIFLTPLILLAACEPEPENIQAKAENMSRQLEQRASELEAEASNAVDAAAAPLDNQAEALLNQAEAAASADNAADNAAANAQ